MPIPEHRLKKLKDNPGKTINTISCTIWEIWRFNVAEKFVNITINGERISLKMKLGKNGVGYFVQEIDAVIGKEDDIGVENLVGFGLIAGETSAAYQEVPTYCLVSGRASKMC